VDPNHPHHKLWHEFNENEAGAASGTVLFHSLGAWRISAAFHDLLFHPAIVVATAQLMRAHKVQLWHDQIFCKPPHNGAVVAWHQDYSYWTRTTPMNHMTVHIALDDETAENGGLRYVPGSHTWSLLPITSRHFNDMESIRTELTPSQMVQFDKHRLATLPKGFAGTILSQAVAVVRASNSLLCATQHHNNVQHTHTTPPSPCAAFHHPLSVHGSYGNTTTNPRRATVVNLFPHGTRSNCDEPLLEGLPLIGRGELLQGKFFPVLYEAK